eukprot:1920148-Rhodomonas_salina.1
MQLAGPAEEEWHQLHMLPAPALLRSAPCLLCSASGSAVPPDSAALLGSAPGPALAAAAGWGFQSSPAFRAAPAWQAFGQPQPRLQSYRPPYDIRT